MPPESGGADSQRAVDCGMKSAAFGLLADADLDHPGVEVAGTAKRFTRLLLDEPPATRAGLLEAFILRLDRAVLQQTLQFVNLLTLLYIIIGLLSSTMGLNIRSTFIHRAVL